jgi:hypothetical protein
LQIETGNMCDIEVGKAGLCCQQNVNWYWKFLGYLTGEMEFLLSTVCKLLLELSGISDWGKRGCVVNSVQIGTGTEWDI